MILISIWTNQKVFDSANPVYLTQGTEEQHEVTDDEQEPKCIMYTTTPYEPEDDDDQATSGSETDDDTDSDTSGDSSEQDSESATDEDEMAEDVGNIYEQGYLEALHGQNLQPEEGLSQSQR